MGRVNFLKKQFLFLLLALLFLSGSSSFPTRVSAAQSGVVCITSTDATGCPSPPPVFSGSPGTNLTVAVNIQGSNSTNGFDISLLTDPSVLNPVAIGYAATVLPSPLFVVVECINGHVVIGARCGATDVPGVARLAIVSLGAETAQPTTGNLFTVTFNIVSGTSSTIGYQTGCTSSSVTGTATCVTVTQCNGSCSAQPLTVVDPEFAQNAPFQTITFNQNVSFHGVTANAFGSLTVDTVAKTITGTVNVVVVNSTTGAVIFSKTFVISLKFDSASSIKFGLALGPSGLVLGGVLNAKSQTTILAVTGNPDILHRGNVDIVDAATLALAFGSSPGSPNWNPAADLMKVGRVDISDAAQLAIYFDMPVLS
ncbi:MAG TPA: hypothetical protein VGS11_01275 [Candidatus Bathyarchaeia archaeon]|nr:hypothetical protein [Candidatus Bathyarchaeia archaeon]